MGDDPGGMPTPAASAQAKDAADAVRTGAAVQATPPLNFQHLFEALPGAHLVVAADPGHVVVAASDEYLRATMTRREDVIGRELFDVFPDNPAVCGADGVNNLRASLVRVAATGRADRMALQRYDIRRPDGVFEERWWQPVNAPLPGPGSKVAHVLHTVEDATAALRERREAADALRAEQDRSRGILESMAEGFILLDHAFGVTEINAEGLRIDGRPREAIVGRHLLEAWPEAERFPIWPAYRRAMAERVPVALEYRYASDRRDLWLDVRAYPVPEGGRLAVFYRDVTARKRAEAALRDSEGRLRALVSASSNVLYRMNADWTGMRQLSGGGFLSDTGSLNRAWLEEYIYPDDQARVLAAIQDAVRTRSVFELEHRVRRADGSLGWTLSRAVPLLDADGGVREWFGAASDVTARKEAEAVLCHSNEALEARVAERTAELSQAADALRQSQKMEAVGQLTGGLAHDFNNLLTGIAGSLELLKARVAQGRLDDLDRYFAAAQGSTSRAAALTHRLLAFSRRQTLEPRATDVNRLVAGMEDLIRRTVGPAVAVEAAGLGDLWSILVDPSQLENALLNLCINARDAMPDGGRLSIETSNHLLEGQAARTRALPPGQYVSLCVSDTGTGMTPEVMAKAFDPFFTTKPIGQGTGLGLSMIYGFVQQSGGQVRIHSELGQGTTVCLYLPRHLGEPEDTDAPADLAQAPRARQGETVLVVDDEATVRMLVADVLGELGYTVVEAEDGAAGLEVLRSDARLDLLITDVGLPGGLNGRQVADAARALRPGLRVLFITGYAETAVLSHGYLEPGMHVLTKPFAMEALAGRIKELTNEKRG